MSSGKDFARACVSENFFLCFLGRLQVDRELPAKVMFTFSCFFFFSKFTVINGDCFAVLEAYD